jgi:hypothetical protein
VASGGSSRSRLAWPSGSSARALKLAAWGPGLTPCGVPATGWGETAPDGAGAGVLPTGMSPGRGGGGGEVAGIAKPTSRAGT